MSKKSGASDKIKVFTPILFLSLIFSLTLALRTGALPTPGGANLTDTGLTKIDTSKAEEEVAYKYVEEGNGFITAKGSLFGKAGAIFARSQDEESAGLFTASGVSITPRSGTSSCVANFAIVREKGTETYKLGVSDPGVNGTTCTATQLISVKATLGITGTGVGSKEITVANSEADTISATGVLPDNSDQSCESKVSGIGFLLCPVIRRLGELNDFMWKISSKLLRVSPLPSDQSDSIYKAWATIRNIANIAFVIVFMIMIFSQVTSFGLTNYGIKKLLPRLIVCVILVNTSYIIMQVVIDVANIVGSSLYDVLAGLAPASQPKWGDLITLLEGGAVAGGVVLGTSMIVGGPAAAFFMVFPMVLAGALSLVAAVLTLIFRQAILPILAIVAPLAFVAGLLPNTEKLLKKWKGLLIPMLTLYPLAALIFGGCRFVAGTMTGSGHDAWDYLIGLIILEVPLFSLPFIAKKSGALVGAVGGFMAGLATKAKAPIKSRFKESQNLSAAKFGANGRGFMANMYRKKQYNQFERKKFTDLNQKATESGFQTKFNSMQKAMDATKGAAKADTLAKTSQNMMDTAIEKQLFAEKLAEKTSAKNLNTAQTQTENLINEASTNSADPRLISELNRMGVTAEARQGIKTASLNNQLEASRKASAERAVRDEYSEFLANDNSKAAQIYAGSVVKNGDIRAQAGAVVSLQDAVSKDIAGNKILMKQQNYNNEELINLTTGAKILKDGSPASDEQVHAGLQLVFEGGDVETMNKVLNYVATRPVDGPGVVLGSEEYKARLAIQQTVADAYNKCGNKEKSIGGGMVAQMSNGTYGSTQGDKATISQEINSILTARGLNAMEPTVQNITLQTILTKGYSVQQFTSMDADETKVLVEAVKSPEGRLLLSLPQFASKRDDLLSKIQAGFESKEYQTMNDKQTLAMSTLQREVRSIPSQPPSWHNQT